MNIGILYELPSVYLELHIVNSAKVVVNAILLAFTGFSRCVADTESKFTCRERLLEEFNECALA